MTSRRRSAPVVTEEDPVFAGTTSREDLAELRPPNRENFERHLARMRAEVAAHRLADIRKARKLTQAQVAEALNVSQPTVSGFERGDLASANLATVRAYVAALGGDVEVVARFGETRVHLA